MNAFFSFLFDVLKIVVIALVIVLPIRYFLFQPFLVSGSSMEPNFHNGDYLIVNEISQHFRPLRRGEVIVFDYPLDPSKKFIKRIIGLPGETLTVKDHHVEVKTVLGKTKILEENSYLSIVPTLKNFSITLDSNQYFVMGDNRRFSYDSRSWGPVPRKNIIGQVWMKLWPFSQAEVVPIPHY